MKASVFSVASLVTVVAAAGSPDVGNLPPCVKECLGPFFTGGEVAGCKQLDYACVCKNTDFLGKIACCANDKCDASSKNAILTFAKPLCNAVGVQVPDDIAETCKKSQGKSSSSAGGAKPTGTNASESQAAATGSKTSSGAPAASSSADSNKNDAAVNSASGVLGAIAAMLMAL